MKRELFSTALRTLLSVLAFSALVAIGTIGGVAFGQVPSANPPFNGDTGALVTDAAAVAGTVNSAQQNNLDKSGVVCTYVASAVSGAPSVTINIQNYDSASNTYYTMSTTGAFIPSSTPTNTMVYPAAQASSDPATFPSNSVMGLPLSRFWRVQRVLSGANTTSTGTLGCNQLR